MKRSIITLIIGSFLLSFTPIDKINAKSDASLFKIERSKDENQIIYDLNKNNKNELRKENPISIYWIRKTEGGKVKPLTWIQQTYAYGLKYTKVSEDEAIFHFVSYNKRKFILKKDDDEFKVFTTFNDKNYVVNRIFIQIDGGSFWFPKISQVKVETTDPNSNKNLTSIIHP